MLISTSNINRTIKVVIVGESSVGKTSIIRRLIDEKFDWYCPNCGNTDHNTLNVARRTCGYIGTNFWNKGRTHEIKERVLHIDNKDYEE